MMRMILIPNYTTGKPSTCLHPTLTSPCLGMNPHYLDDLIDSFSEPDGVRIDPAVA